MHQMSLPQYKKRLHPVGSSGMHPVNVSHSPPFALHSQTKVSGVRVNLEQQQIMQQQQLLERK